MFLSVKAGEWVVTVCWVCLGNEKMWLCGKFCGEKTKERGKKVGKSLGNLGKREMWGLKMRAWSYECAFRGFIKECTLCFLENIGRKVEKNKILERFKGDSSSSIRRRRRRRRLQPSATSCHFRPPLIEKLLLEKPKISKRKMEEGFSISLSFFRSVFPLSLSEISVKRLPRSRSKVSTH